MERTTDTLPLTTDPIWPWSIPGVGWPLLATVAVLLLLAAAWSYLRVPGAKLGRVSVVLGLRLLALFLVFLALAGTSCVSTRDIKVPSTLVILLDFSKSMLVKDENAGRSRWDEMIVKLRECRELVEKLRQEHNISTVFVRFGDDVADVDIDELLKSPDGRAIGERTDTSQPLKTLFDRFRGEKYMRALLIISDGADNVANDPPARSLAASWRTLPCPVHVFTLGSKMTTSSQNDIVVTSLTPKSSIVSAKGKLTVTATIDALGGMVNSQVRVKLFFDDKEVASQDETLRLRKDNQVQMTVNAPATAGELKVTLKVHDPNQPGQALPGELSASNNEMRTYVTVSQDGLKVLLIDRQDHFPEPQLILKTLAADKRMSVYPAWLRGEVHIEGGKSLLDFDQESYDVIILGDVSAKRLLDADPDALKKIVDRVQNKRTGLLMLPGRFAFGNGDWAGTPIEDILPTRLDEESKKGRRAGGINLRVTPDGLDYVLRLTDRPEDTQAKWDKIKVKAGKDAGGQENTLFGYTPVGSVKEGSIRMAETDTGQPLLVGRNVGTGRTMVFAGETTHRWLRPKFAGEEVHSRFWRQIVLWLAHQDKSEDNLRIRLDTRRLRTGDNLGFSVELQGKKGEAVPDAKFIVKVIDPKGNTFPVEVVPGAKKSSTENQHRVYPLFKPKLPGEYRVEAAGSGKTVTGEAANGQNTARFEAFQDDAESSEKAANPDFLKDLAQAGGGQDYRPAELKKYLERLPTLPLPSPPPRPAKFPDWRQTKGASPFLLAFILLFVQVLALEWFLRRRWGMV